MVLWSQLVAVISFITQREPEHRHSTDTCLTKPCAHTSCRKHSSACCHAHYKNREHNAHTHTIPCCTWRQHGSNRPSLPPLPLSPHAGNLRPVGRHELGAVAVLLDLADRLQPPAVAALALPHIGLLGRRELDLSRRRVHAHKDLLGDRQRQQQQGRRRARLCESAAHQATVALLMARHNTAAVGYHANELSSCCVPAKATSLPPLHAGTVPKWSPQHTHVPLRGQPNLHLHSP